MTGRPEKSQYREVQWMAEVFIGRWWLAIGGICLIFFVVVVPPQPWPGNLIQYGSAAISLLGAITPFIWRFSLDISSQALILRAPGVRREILLKDIQAIDFYKSSRIQNLRAKLFARVRTSGPNGEQFNLSGIGFLKISISGQQEIVVGSRRPQHLAEILRAACRIA